MDFKDFEDFNYALLAKQCQCIILSPSSLVAQCLQAKHYPSGSFLDASLGGRSSYLQRSLLEGRNLLSLCLRHCMGNSLSTNIQPDKWIPSLSGFTPFPLFLSRGKERKVTKNIEFNQCYWREDELDIFFPSCGRSNSSNST